MHGGVGVRGYGSLTHRYDHLSRWYLVSYVQITLWKLSVSYIYRIDFILSMDFACPVVRNLCRWNCTFFRPKIMLTFLAYFELCIFCALRYIVTIYLYKSATHFSRSVQNTLWNIVSVTFSMSSCQNSELWWLSQFCVQQRREASGRAVWV